MTLTARLFKSLKHFALDVEIGCGEGQCLCLTGCSGSGKTTILRILAGLESMDAGEIAFRGRTWAATQKGETVPARARRVGYLSQDYPLFPHLSLHRNALFAARNRKDGEKWLKRFGLWELRDRKVGRISGGERQRGALAQILAAGPELLLLDEPFSALDHTTKRRMYDVLRELKEEQGLPVVMVTHDPAEARLLGDERMHIRRGRSQAPVQVPFSLQTGCDSEPGRLRAV